MGRYVLSAYFGHDASLALVGEGKLVHLEAERITRKKHENALQGSFVREEMLPQALRLIGATADEIVAVCEVGCGDQFSSSRTRDHWDRSLVAWDFLDADPSRANYLERPLPCYFVAHHLAHAAYAFYTSAYETARVGALDGGGDAWNDGAGKTAVISAAVGETQHRFGEAESRWVFEVTEDGAHIGGNWAGQAVQHCGSWQAAGTIMAMVGIPELRFEMACGLSLADRARIVQLQADTTQAFHRMFAPAPAHEGQVALAGGCALNGIAAYDLLLRPDVRAVHVPPAVHDGGLTVGAALFALHAILKEPRRRYSPEAVAFSGYSDEALDAPLPVEAIVGRILAGKAVAVAHGRAESGPRALGHRSILGDPRSLVLKDRLNVIKSRKAYRPVAPVVLRQYADAYFELKNADCYPFMTMIAKATARAEAEIPAGIHLDGTARVQVVDVDSDIGRLVEAFRQETGVPILLNTSFNLGGEAMVNTVEQAQDTFGRSRIDCLAAGGAVLDCDRAW